MATFNRPSELPVDQVKSLQARGFDNNQIVQALQRSGYSSTQIFDALNQASLVNAGMMMDGPPGSYPVQQSPQSSFGDPGTDAAGSAPDDFNDDQVEEMIEAIVDEKWQAAAKDFAKFNEWKADYDARIAKLEARVEELKSSFDKLHQAVIGKVGEYDKNILSVGAEIKAMERVFSKVLPVFTENVNELNRITQQLTGKPK